MLTYVATGNADPGIVYSVDAKTSYQVRIAAIAPEDSHSPLICPIAGIKNSREAADDGIRTPIAFNSAIRTELSV